MKRLVAAMLTLVALVQPGIASAHPLGNFTINHYSRIEPAGDRVRVVYVLDMAEIPTFQERARIDPNPEAYADERVEQLRQNLRLDLDGKSSPLRLEQRSLSLAEGQGGLPTLRLEAVFAADLKADPATPIELLFRDNNDPARLGWREIVAAPGSPGAQIQRSNVPATDVTHELKQYPDDLLSSPLNVREARLTFLPGVPGPKPLPPTGVAMLDRTRSAFAELASGTDLTPNFMLFAVGVALVLGAAHALQPGHGKTIVGAYLVGSRGTARHALFLGATVTATHTAGVYALGLVTLGLSQYILPDRLYPVLEIASGLLVVGIGIWLFGSRLMSALGLRAPHDHDHRHDHEHEHEHGHSHSHPQEHETGIEHAHPHAALAHGSDRVSWRSLLALGVSGGLLPCPEALMVLLITVAAHRVLFGLLLIVAFSTGLAGVLVAFGLLLVYARGYFSHVNLSGGLVQRVLPVASALVIVVAGGVITVQALPRVL